jgi:hypothetical protein
MPVRAVTPAPCLLAIKIKCLNRKNLGPQKAIYILAQNNQMAMKVTLLLYHCEGVLCFYFKIRY